MCDDWDDEDYNEELESIYKRIKAERAYKGEDVDAPITVTKEMLVEERRRNNGEEPLPDEKPKNIFDIISSKISVVAAIGMGVSLLLARINIFRNLFFGFLGVLIASGLLKLWLGIAPSYNSETHEEIKYTLGKKIRETLVYAIVMWIAFSLLFAE